MLNEYEDYFDEEEERIREYRRNWQRNNKDKVREYQRKYYQKNKEKIRSKRNQKCKEYMREYRKNNPEKIKKTQEKFKQTHNWSEYCGNARKRRVERLRKQGCINAWKVVNGKNKPKYKEEQ